MIGFLGGRYERSPLERNAAGIVRIDLTAAQAAAAAADGSVTVAIRATPGYRVSSRVLTRAGGFGFAGNTIDTDGSYQPVTLTVTSAGIRAIAFGIHTIRIIDVIVATELHSGQLDGWLDTASRLPLGPAKVSPRRTEHRSISGKYLGASVAPAAEMVTLSMRGISSSSMRSAGRDLIDALAVGEVRFTISSPIAGQSNFTAWLEGDMGLPVLRQGGFYDWQLSLRRSA